MAHKIAHKNGSAIIHRSKADKLVFRRGNMGFSGVFAIYKQNDRIFVLKSSLIFKMNPAVKPRDEVFLYVNKKWENLTHFEIFLIQEHGRNRFFRIHSTNRLAQ